MHQPFAEFVLAKRSAAGLHTDWTAVSHETTETGVADLFYTVL